MTKRPNVILLMADQLRADVLGCYGNKIVETPNIDYLAAHGTVFTHAYSCSPSCVPARQSILTGQNIWSLGFMWTGSSPGALPSCFENPLPECLSQAGYHTQAVGKLNVTPQRSLQGFHHTILDEAGQVKDPGFESDYMKWFKQHRPADVGKEDHGIGWNSWMSRPWHLPEYLHPTAWTAKESIDFLHRRDPSKPFFLKTSFHRPHSPYDPPSYFFDLYNRRQDIPMPEAGEWAEALEDPLRAAAPDTPFGRRSPEETRRARVGYYGSVSFVDNQIGRLISTLSKGRVIDNTIIIFTSDHGDMLGDNLRWRKGCAYEGSSHIPFIVWLPKSMRNHIHSHCDAPVSLEDVMPTILDACNVKIPKTVDGKSVLPLIQGKRTPWRKFIHGEHGGYQSEFDMHYLTDGHWKYIWYYRTHKEQLFHLDTDPKELYDLAESKTHQKDLRLWRDRLIETLKPRKDGMVKNNRLVCQHDKPLIVTSHYRDRVERVTKKQNQGE